VYAENAAIKAGRFDLAKAYGRQAVRLLPPPKKAIAVKPVESKGKEIVILPKEDDGLQDDAIDSPALTTLETQDKGIQGQIDAGKAPLAKETKATDKAVAAEMKDAAKEEAQPSFFQRWKFLGIPLALVAGGIALVCLFPALLPLVIGLFGMLRKAVNAIITLISSLWRK
jgi:hypothetical protein